jgi:serine/threonine protein kinase
MLSGKVPFNARSSNLTANEIILKIKTAEFSFDDPVWDSVSDSAKDLITGLLTVDPKKRLKIGQLIRHPWLRECSDGHIRELQTPTILPEIGKLTYFRAIQIYLFRRKI